MLEGGDMQLFVVADVALVGEVLQGDGRTVRFRCCAWGGVVSRYHPGDLSGLGSVGDVGSLR